MSGVLLAAVITGLFSLAGVMISNWAMSKKSEKERAVDQAVMNTKIDELTREVREHNNFAQKMPVMQQEIKELERRVSCLEKYHQAPVN